ncbi:hypothetical protein [Clostridium sp. Cult1]|uniref:hypothetical protein n=1 Tax=Clostridium sp. Cult1 TaxID=2079002 RepID=UPI001F174C42|nr:hypothetical protein [Clostridium sp. Cult1]
MAKTTKKTENKFTKSQVLESKKFTNKDLINAILEDGRMYTLKEVEKIINNYLKRKVK